MPTTVMNLRALVLTSLMLAPVLGCGGGAGADTSSESGLTVDTGSTESETGSDAIDLGPCAAFVKCTSAVLPGDPAEEAEAAYGEDGYCYTAQSVAQCWADCLTGLEGFAGLYPDEPYCQGAECTSDAECTNPDEPSCWDDYTCGPRCGNGLLEADELCDSTPACTAACTFEYHECSPLTHAPCAEGAKCFTQPHPEVPDAYYFTCVPDIVGPAGLGEECANQTTCSQEAPLCSESVLDCPFDFCCTKWCYMGESIEDYSCPPGAACEDLLLSGVQPGVEQIGFCW
jgi:hypothetical protein